MPPEDPTTPAPKITVDDFMEAAKQTGQELLDELDARQEFLDFLEQMRPEIEHFAAAGNQDQLGVVAFRFRTWARSHTLKAIRASEAAIWSLAFTGLRFLVAV